MREARNWTMTVSTLADVIEAILFVSGNEVSVSEITEKLNVSDMEIYAALEILKNRFSRNNGINLLVFNDKLQFSSNPELVDYVSAVLNPIREKELTKAMLETLSIIAYKQPITKAEIEELRGVDSSYAISMLVKLDMIYVAGKKDAIGKPLLYKTTDEFLKRFSLTSLSELPDTEQLMERIKTLESDVSRSLFDFDDEESEFSDFRDEDNVRISANPFEEPQDDFFGEEGEIRIIK